MTPRNDAIHSITVVGLGSGDPGQLTRAADDAIRSAREVWLRTTELPGIEATMHGIAVRSFDELYEHADSFDEVYRGIAELLLEAAARGPVVYAVPGDPATGEASVALLRDEAARVGAPLVVLPGVSFLGPVLDALGWDAFDGVQLADATALALRHYPNLDPDRPAVVAQVYSRLVASDLKIVLLGAYPPEHPVVVVAGAGTPTCRKRAVSLSELDHDDDFDDCTTLGVPALARPASMTSLADVVARLRAPDGCPWDRAQTHESLRPYVLEEAYEVLATLDEGDDAALAEELGDLLLQIVLHAQLASEDGAFSLADVTRTITEKIVRRHPHVFGDERADTPDAVRGLWEELKAGERAARGAVDDPFAGVPRTLPALARAQAIQRKALAAGRVGTADELVFGEHDDPDERTAVRARDAGAADAGAEEDAADAAGLTDESWEPDVSHTSDLSWAADDAAASAAVGQALWELVAAAEHRGIDAETALRETTGRHLARLAAIGARQAAETGDTPGDDAPRFAD